MPTSKDFTYTCVLFTLFRNVMNYRNLNENARVRHLPVMKRTYALYSYIILCTCSLENNAFSVMHYVKKVTLHYLILHRFEIHSAWELSRAALLCCRLAASRLCEAARWQSYFDIDHSTEVGTVIVFMYVRTSINFAVRYMPTFFKWNAPWS